MNYVNIPLSPELLSQLEKYQFSIDGYNPPLEKAILTLIQLGLEKVATDNAAGRFNLITEKLNDS